MTPLDRVRLEKAASDCGFEMTPEVQPNGLLLRSAHFPETLLVQVAQEKHFLVTPSDPALLHRQADPAAPIDGYGALYKVLHAAAAFARTRPNRIADHFKKKTAHLPKTTEAERLVVQRVGQELFRKALLDYWQGQCCITGLNLTPLLRASHIRPWAACDTDDQRLDVFNGLLLAPHLDALFDAGLMTIEDHGSVRFAEAIGPTERAQLGLAQELAVPNLRKEHRVYLEFHRARVWQG